MWDWHLQLRQTKQTIVSSALYKRKAQSLRLDWSYGRYLLASISLLCNVRLQSGRPIRQKVRVQMAAIGWVSLCSLDSCARELKTVEFVAGASVVYCYTFTLAFAISSKAFAIRMHSAALLSATMDPRIHSYWACEHASAHSVELCLCPWTWSLTWHTQLVCNGHIDDNIGKPIYLRLSSK